MCRLILLVAAAALLNTGLAHADAQVRNMTSWFLNFSVYAHNCCCSTTFSNTFSNFHFERKRFVLLDVKSHSYNIGDRGV